MALGEKTYKPAAAQPVEKIFDWRAPHRVLVVQDSRGMCGNLINALKLLANQQEDGDGLIQNIVSRRG